MWDTGSKVLTFRLQMPSEVLPQALMLKQGVLYGVGILSIILAYK